MKRNKWTVAAGTMLFSLILTGCGAAEGDRQAAPEAENQGPGAESAMPEAPSGETDRDSAFALALENAGVPEGDAYNVKVEQDKEHEISIWQVDVYKRQVWRSPAIIWFR